MMPIESPRVVSYLTFIVSTSGLADNKTLDNHVSRDTALVANLVNAGGRLRSIICRAFNLFCV